MANYAEQIAAFEAKHAANVATLKSLADKAGDAGETFDAEAQEQFDELTAENEAIEKHLSRLRTLEKMAKASAKPVDGSGEKAGSESRDPTVPARVKAGEKLDKGIGFARLAKVKALAKLDGESVRTVAKELYGEDSSIYGLVTDRKSVV